MATNIIMPALGMAQDTGKIIRWLKAEDDRVKKGEPIMEVETDKVTVEIEAQASGILANITAAEGEDVPVGQVIALILEPGETPPEKAIPSPTPKPSQASAPFAEDVIHAISATPIASRIATEHQINLRSVKPEGGKVSKADMEAYLQAHHTSSSVTGKVLASPKARRLAQEENIDLTQLSGSGPGGVIISDDVISLKLSPQLSTETQTMELSTIWRVMSSRITQSWTQVPHFYLLREVNASRLVQWRENILHIASIHISYTDILVKLLAIALGKHPRLNATWKEDIILVNQNINIGIAVAVEDGLIVPVVHHADRLSLEQIAKRREDMVKRANEGKLQSNDIQGGTFTITNLGMYGIDVFNAVINPPEAAILSVGRIVDRVVPIDSQPIVQPMMLLSLSCDHRVVDGARGAEFLQTMAGLIEEPLALLN